MVPLLSFIADPIISTYEMIIVITIILSWLVQFGIVNAYQPFVRGLQQLCSTLTEPLLGPIRRALPNMGGIDISPIILWLGLEFVRRVVIYGWLIPAFHTL